MKEAVNFLVEVFATSYEDLAFIYTAEAENNREAIIKYLANVKDYTEGLIEKVKNNE